MSGTCDKVMMSGCSKGVGEISSHIDRMAEWY